MQDEIEASEPKTRIPAIALVWGWAGVVPFVMLAVVTTFGAPGHKTMALQILVPYSAIILTFMGGVHWGLVIGRQHNCRYLYTTGIMPSLAALVAIAVPMKFAFVVLGGGFISILLYDLWLVRRAILPNWYGGLRIQLTLAVVACLTAAGLSGQS